MNQKPRIPSWPGIFQFDILFSVVLSKSMCVSALGPSLNPSSSLVIFFIHSAFSLWFFWLAYFSPKSFRFFGIWLLVFFRVTPLAIVDRIFFRCFGKSCFVCSVLPFVDISLISLLLPARSGLFPQVVLLFFLLLPFPFCSRIFQRLSFVLLF